MTSSAEPELDKAATKCFDSAYKKYALNQLKVWFKAYL